jgi:hypothetical protein
VEAVPALAVTVPPGATLLGLAKSVYGEGAGDLDPRELFAEVRRLNPHVKDVNLILAGDSLRLPPLSSAPSGRGAASTP